MLKCSYAGKKTKLQQQMKQENKSQSQKAKTSI